MSKGQDKHDSLVAIAKVVKAQGLDGELKVIPFSGDPEELASYNKIFLGRGLNRQPYTVGKCRAHGKSSILKLLEIVDRNGSEAFIGAEVLVPKSQMPALASDEFYWREMVGLQVMTDQGQDLGEVTSLIATGGHDILVVTGRGHEYLIPVLKEIIVRQDTEAGILVVAPMAGLLEMNMPDAI